MIYAKYSLGIICHNGCSQHNYLDVEGLDLLHELTSVKSYKLRIDMGDFDGNRRFAEYSSVNISSSATNYKLKVGTYTGTAGNHDRRIFLSYSPSH